MQALSIDGYDNKLGSYINMLGSPTPRIAAKVYK
jgi:hypothetical protein